MFTPAGQRTGRRPASRPTLSLMATTEGTSTLVDFDEFHTVELPRRLAGGNGALAAGDAAGLGALGFRLRETGSSYTYVPTGDTIAVVAGAEQARTVVEIDQASWEGLVTDMETAPGLLYSDRITCTGGSALRFVRWEPALRAMFHGRPIFDPEATPLFDREGEPLDPTKTFTFVSDRDEMAHFLHTAGFIVVKGVFDDDEVTRFRAAADRLRAGAVGGDRLSWWGKNASGVTVLCRVTNAGKEPDLRALYEDERLLGLAALSEYELTAKAVDSDEGVTVLWKNPDMTEGLSNIPWHRDCGMGGHALMCPLLIATVCLTGGGPDSGELRGLPGSWQASYPYIDAEDPDAPLGVGLDVEPGDVSLHYSDVMHASCAPRGDGPYRTSLLMAFVPDRARQGLRDGGYNRVLFRSDDGQVEHLADFVDR